MEGTGTYHDGHTAREYRCRVVLSADSLHIFFNEDGSNFLIWQLSEFESCHINKKLLIIKYGAFPHQSLECEGKLASQIYHAWSSRSVVRKAGSLSFRSNTLISVSLVLAFVLLGLFTWLVLLPWVGEKAANYVPMETEISLGDKIAGAYASEGSVDDSLSILLQQFADRLDLSKDYPLRLTVIRSDQINAFALPGGRIFVYSGILEGMNSYGELVALLGHEVTHVNNRHSLRSICRSAATSIFIASLFGDITGISSGILSQADQFKELDYSRDLETEADSDGLSLMISNKVSGSGMLDLLNLLKEERAEMPAMMKYLSTHPDTDSRIANIKKSPYSKMTFPENAELAETFGKIKSAINER